jgi:hypothetical protein
MEVLSEGPDWVSFNDGARASWTTHLVCTCLTAKRQPAAKVCCKHTVYVIRTKLDYLFSDVWHNIPVVLTDEDGASAWVQVIRRDKKLYVHLQNEVLVGSEVECRLDARNLVIPYLLGLHSWVTCTQCEDSDKQWTEQQMIRRVCFWLANPTSDVCVYHSLDDLIPTF